MNVNYTPGTWVWEPGSSGHGGGMDEPPEEGHDAYVYDIETDYVIAICPEVTYKEDPESEYDDGIRYYGNANANAALIAESKELLWATEYMFKMLSESKGHFTIDEQNRVQSAIERAKGMWRK